MDRGELRENVLGMRRWQADVDTDFVKRVNTICIKPAVKRLASEVPEALLPDNIVMQLFAERTTATLKRTVAATTDPWVLDFGLDTLTGALPLATDGTWDGIFHITVTFANGKTARRQCRTFWKPSSGLMKDHYLCSIDVPWPNTTDTGLSFRLYQPYGYTPADVIRLLDGRVYNSTRQVVTLLPAATLRRRDGEDYNGLTKGTPVAFSRGPKVVLQTPTKAPTATSTLIGTPWAPDQEPPGTFEYCYTFGWGTLGAEQRSPGGSYYPVWESAPSPPSNALTVAYPAASVVEGLVNIAWMQRFDPNPAELRNGRTGFRKILYRRRTAVTAGGTTVQNIDLSGVWYYLYEVDDVTTSYRDVGSVIPDYSRRLPESKGYWSWAPYPQPDQDYEVDLRVLRAVPEMENDSDVVPFDASFEDMLQNLVLSNLCAMDGDPAESQRYEGLYKERLLAFRAEQASSSDFIPGEAWDPEATTRKDGDLRYEFE